VRRYRGTARAYSSPAAHMSPACMLQEAKGKHTCDLCVASKVEGKVECCGLLLPGCCGCTTLVLPCNSSPSTQSPSSQLL
jgi:hypothetical protein